ncbi:hypothetical protein PG996_006746 [Apiospora saccharicola]|uniref:Uncharacterized protein n=1 Tax=Apiospora saccharicola TaxID=335842 RepID=A0ABR1V8V6_9PEZI
MHASNVIFKPPNMYAKKPNERRNIVTLIVEKAPDEAGSAIVRGGWHSSRKDKRVHLTVDFLDCSSTHLLQRRVGPGLSRQEIVHDQNPPNTFQVLLQPLHIGQDIFRLIAVPIVLAARVKVIPMDQIVRIAVVFARRRVQKPPVALEIHVIPPTRDFLTSGLVPDVVADIRVALLVHDYKQVQVQIDPDRLLGRRADRVAVATLSIEEHEEIGLGLVGDEKQRLHDPLLERSMPRRRANGRGRAGRFHHHDFDGVRVEGFAPPGAFGPFAEVLETPAMHRRHSARQAVLSAAFLKVALLELLRDYHPRLGLAATGGCVGRGRRGDDGLGPALGAVLELGLRPVFGPLRLRELLHALGEGAAKIVDLLAVAALFGGEDVLALRLVDVGDLVLVVLGEGVPR